MILITRFRRLLAEAQRRRVTRAAAAYSVVAAAVIALANDALPNLGLPPWTVTLVIVLAIAAFPFTVVLAWAFDVTSAGIVRTVNPAAAPLQPAELLTIAPANSVAVLPFVNMGLGAEEEYFSDGMTEDIIAQLSQLASLRVISRTSVMRYKKAEKTTREIAAELGVQHVIEGSVRRAGNRLRIVAQLIDAQRDSHLWADTYDRDLADVFAIQTDVAERVAEALRMRLSPAERSRLARRPTDSLEAYNHYLMGRYHYNQGNPYAFQNAIDCYERAIQCDPKFARAYAAITLPYIWHGAGYYGMRPRVAFAKITAAAQKALELDSDNADAHIALADYELLIRYDWSTAAKHIERALTLNPNSADAYLMYGWYLVVTGRPAEAVEASHQALALDPSAPVVRGWAIYNMYVARHLDEAAAVFDAARAQSLIDPLLMGCGAMVLLALGRRAEAVDAFRKYVELAPITKPRTLLAWGLAAGGHPEAARSLLRELHTLEKTEFVWPVGIAFAYMALGETERALDYLEQAYEERVSSFLIFGGSAPCFDQLRGHARFEALINRIGALPLTIQAPLTKDQPVSAIA